MRADRLSQAGKALLIGCGASLALAGCTTAERGNALAANTSAADQAHPGSSVRTGAQTNGMAAQYSMPRLGPVSAAGASAWVAPAPPPAFVVNELPPAAAPAPGAFGPPPSPPPAPAARQPAVDASQLVRPEAATPETPAPAAAAPVLSAATRAEGRRIFANYSCSSCHTLADAGASGSIGPGLDGNRNLTKDYIVETVKTGRGAMPSFAGQLTDEEIDTLADYILAARK